MADLAPSDEWYVAINGVPVGPIRVAEIRRKAALGAVTEESLCWQEGFDEWRAVRSFPDLALIVREAATSGRSSLPPAQSEGRSSVASPARSPSARPAPPRAPVARPVATPAPPMARSNVVPFTSRLATAERFEEAPDDQTRPVASPFLEAAVVADPFANPPGAAAARAAAAPMVTQHAPVISEAAAASLAAPAPAAKAPPWMAIAMVAAATAFGVTAAIAVFFRPAAAPTQLTTQPAAGITTAAGPAPLVAPAAPAVPASAAQAEPIAIAPEPTALPGAPRSSPGANGAGKPAPAAPQGAVATKGPLDLGGLGGTIRPTDDPGDSPKAAGQCFSSGQVSQVIGLHQPGIRRSCWERNPTTKPTVNVSVSLTIGSDGAPQSVSASADEPSVAKCVENDVRTWRFPAMGCSQQTSFSFHFVRQ